MLLTTRSLVNRKFTLLSRKQGASMTVLKNHRCKQITILHTRVKQSQWHKIVTHLNTQVTPLGLNNIECDPQQNIHTSQAKTLRGKNINIQYNCYRMTKSVQVTKSGTLLSKFILLLVVNKFYRFTWSKGISCYINTFRRQCIGQIGF